MSSATLWEDASKETTKMLGGEAPTSGRERLGKIAHQAARWFVRVLRGVFWILVLPIRILLWIRSSLTPASVTLLLLGIVSLNIVWGYPWMGMFAACSTMLGLGFLINRATRPKLKLDFSLPASSPAGEPFVLTMHALNRGALPAMELLVSMAWPERAFSMLRWIKSAGGLGGRWGHRKDGAPRDFLMANRAASERSSEIGKRLDVINTIGPNERIDLSWSLVSTRRGIHTLPDVVVTSLFPFHLFRLAQRFPSETSVAITPALLNGEDDTVHRRLLDALGGFSHRLLAGDALHYTGSREYEVGMPVRRWDFTSWARLGRPIVREYQSPSAQMITLIVDTSRPSRQPIAGAARSVVQEIDPSLETLLSFAATALTQWSRKQLRIQMYVTSESTAEFVDSTLARGVSDAESLLLQLASADAVDAQTGRDRVSTVLGAIGRTPTLILSNGDQFADLASAHQGVSLIDVEAASRERVDPGHCGSRKPRALRKQVGKSSAGEKTEARPE